MKRFLLSILLLAVLLIGGPRLLELLLGSAPAERSTTGVMSADSVMVDVKPASDSVSVVVSADTLMYDSINTKDLNL